MDAFCFTSNIGVATGNCITFSAQNNWDRANWEFPLYPVTKWQTRVQDNANTQNIH